MFTCQYNVDIHFVHVISVMYTACLHACTCIMYVWLTSHKRPYACIMYNFIIIPKAYVNQIAKQHIIILACMLKLSVY